MRSLSCLIAYIKHPRYAVCHEEPCCHGMSSWHMVWHDADPYISSLYAVLQVSAVCTLHALSMLSACECRAQGSSQTQEAASRRPPCPSLRLWSSAALASSARQ